MPVPDEMIEREQDPALDPEWLILLEAHLCRDPVCFDEPDSVKIIDQPVGILLQHTDRISAVGLIQFQGVLCADVVFLQLQGDSRELPLLSKGFRDFGCSLWPDPGHLRQPVRFVLDDMERLVPEQGDHSGSRLRPDALEGSGGKKIPDPFL